MEGEGREDKTWREREAWGGTQVNMQEYTNVQIKWCDYLLTPRPRAPCLK